MVWPVSLVGVPARRALPARVAWIDEKNRNAAQGRLVGDERAELSERPVVEPCPLTAPGRYPVADTLEIFERNSAAGAFSSRNERLRDAVVDVALEPALPASEFAEPPLGSLGAALLETGTATGKMGANLFDGFACHHVAVAVGRDVDDPEIDTEPVFGVEPLGFWDVAGASEEPLSADEAEIDLALSVSHQLALTSAHNDRDRDASNDRPERHGVDFLGEPQDTVVVWLGRERTKDGCFLSVDLERVGDLGDRPNRCLRGQTELGAKLIIGELVEIELPEHAGLVATRRKPRARGVAALKGLPERVRLLLRRQELYRSHELHASKIEADGAIARGRGFLPGVNAGVSAAKSG